MVGSSSSSNKTQIPSSSSATTKPSKSKFKSTYFLSKSLIIILALLVFFFFPSQAPEFFKKNTILTKLWDLIYLLVIGIAVSYGLFSRKIDTTLHTSSDDNTTNNNIGEQNDAAYLSGISHISSIFEHNSYGFEDNNKSLFEGFEIGNKNKKLNQYCLGESMVVIDDESYVLEQLCGSRSKSAKQNKPLRLPVRNLGSKSLDSAAAGKSVVEDSSSSGWDETKFGKFRGLVPIKLEEKFKEADSDSGSDSDSRVINMRSKSMKLEKQEDTDFNNLDFQGLKSQSMRSGVSSKIKNFSEKDEFNRYRKPPYRKSETSFMELKPQESNIGSFSEQDFNVAFDEEIMKDFVKGKVDDDRDAQFVKSNSQSSNIGTSSERNMETFKNMLRNEENADISDSIPKPANVYKKGKSVRTNRSKEQVVEAKVKPFQVQTDEKVETRSQPGISDMNVKGDEFSDTEPHSGEVDRKAEEFIAKFREQIRLQKVASARKLNLL
ncbi:hypothetical protein QVD17_23060 [Tagetes erecta]|uniref:Uncharacterized protein n=1 Tax=Tagetes erecta TaxID=13708 RepID=A0AAD8NM09_TARER|nr:hypothetical protein QVD17_23060 [Tagetes erecta]